MILYIHDIIYTCHSKTVLSILLLPAKSYLSFTRCVQIREISRCCFKYSKLKIFD